MGPDKGQKRADPDLSIPLADACSPAPGAPSGSST